MAENPTNKPGPDIPDFYTVGFGKPPVQTRFQKGRSGNLKGRPKGSLNLKTSLLKALAERVDVKEGGRRKRISKLEAGTKQLANRIASGDARALQQLLGVGSMVGLTAAAETDAPLGTAADEQVLAQMLLRMQGAGVGAKSPDSEVPAAPPTSEAGHED
jgi:hypothetical protein